MDVPNQLRPVFKGEESQINFYVGVSMRIIRSSGDFGITREDLFSIVPKYVPSLCKYYERHRRSRHPEKKLKWASDGQMTVLWKELCGHPHVVLESRRFLVYVGTTGQRFHSETELVERLAEISRMGGAGLDLESVLLVSFRYTLDMKPVSGVEAILKKLYTKRTVVCSHIAEAVRHNQKSFTTQERNVVQWQLCGKELVDKLVESKQVEILPRRGGSCVIVAVTDSGRGGKSTIV